MSLSIITAIHNSFAMNQLYWDCISKNTTSPFELIVVDNHSTDGSEIFFQELSKKFPEKVIYLRNAVNQLYPVSQNQGIEKARFPILCFLNNDIWLPKRWNEPFEEKLRMNPLLVLSPSGQEAQPSQRESDQLKNKWKRVTMISRIWAKLFFKTELERLWKSLSWMYGDLENFSSPTSSASTSMPGIKGDTVIFHKELLKKCPEIWDERVEAADWHLYLTLAKKHEEDPTIPLPEVLLNVYGHHFGRYSARQNYEPIASKTPKVSLDSLWDPQTIQRLWWGNKLP